MSNKLTAKLDSLTVSNRQRSVPVKLAEYERMFAKLAEFLFRNLLASPPKHLKKTLIKQISERGLFSVVFVSNAQIKKLNSEWMGKNRPTDVLSFPLEMETPPPGIPWEVGEVVISLQRAGEQAKEYGHSFRREVAFLFVHGMLHVLGFDHMQPSEEKEMFGRQKQILENAGFRR